MILHPLSNTPHKFIGGFGQSRPRLTQDFNGRPEFYAQFGLKSHGGVDFGSNGNKTIYAPFAGQAKVINSGKNGYGLHIKIRDGEKECVLGHLSEAFILDGANVHMGDKIGLMGTTGLSSGIHLHFGLRFTENVGALWSRKILNEDNGWHGYVDPLEFMLCWKGTQNKLDY